MKVYRANKRKKKFSALAICLLLTVVMVTGATLAYLFTGTTPVENTFIPAKVGNHIVETNNGTTKEAVKVQNSIKGTTDSEIVDAYIRATYVVNWVKTENGVKYILPADTDDYTVSLNLNNSAANDVTGKWVSYGDYYYFTGVVVPGAYTDVLINSIAPKADAAPEGCTVADGYKLNVEIVSQSIQAEGVNSAGKTPIEIAWKVKISGDTVTAVS